MNSNMLKREYGYIVGNDHATFEYLSAELKYKQWLQLSSKSNIIFTLKWIICIFKNINFYRLKNKILN